ncbi:MAG: HDOD domain-containing protein, partial [Proteobacteria bacterium]|nr:HDOD domain-containing protein [Pseudomonadota bacterium]
QDPSLALRVVRLANSAAYGQSREVNSLQRAFAVIGLGQLSAVLAGIASVDRCERFVNDPDFDWGAFWGHCSGTAFIASSLAGRLGLRFQGAEFLGGLLHDVGYLALAKFDPARFRAAMRFSIEKHGFLSQAVESVFGVGTPEAGEMLAEASSLAPEVRLVIRHHRAPEAVPAGSRALVGTVSLANALAHLAGMTFGRGTADVEVVVRDLPAWRLLEGMKPAMAEWDVARLVFELEREYVASQGFVTEVRPTGSGKNP